MNPTLKKFLNEKVIAIISALIAAFTARLHTPGVVGSAAQTIVIAVASAVFLVLVWRELRRLAGAVVATGVCTALAFVLPALLTLMLHKELDIDRRIPAHEALARQLDSCDRVIWQTSYNSIKRHGDRPVVARDGEGTIHVLVEFEWMKREGSVVAEHIYEGAAYLKAKTRSAAGGFVIDPFRIADFTIGPKQGFWAYLGGWLETPFLLSEAAFLTRWVDGCLQGSVS